MRLILVMFLALTVLFSCIERSTVEPDDDGGNGGGSSLELSGSLEGTLSDAGQAYIVTGDIRVDSLKSLTLEPGVWLQFADQTRLTVKGRLTASGSAAKPVRFEASSSHWQGIHIRNATGLAVLSHCIVEDVLWVTPASEGYGAIEINNAAAEITNCIIRYNQVDFGGGLAVINADLVLHNNLIHDNRAVVFGGGLFGFESTTELINNTFVDNFSENSGGGIYYLTSVLADIQNNIFFRNSAFSGGNHWVAFGDSGMVTLQYNFLDISASDDPLFISETDYHLQILSPARNRGNPGPAYNDPDGTRNDQGAYGGPLGDW